MQAVHILQCVSEWLQQQQQQNENFKEMYRLFLSLFLSIYLSVCPCLTVQWMHAAWVQQTYQMQMFVYLLYKFIIIMVWHLNRLRHTNWHIFIEFMLELFGIYLVV